MVIFLPAVVADDHVAAAVLIVDHYLGEHRLTDAVRVDIGRGEYVQVAVPSASEHGAEAVRAGLEHVADVVGVVHDAVAVVGPSGVEPVIADAAAVNVELVYSAGGHIESRGLHRLGDVHIPAEHRSGDLPVGLPHVKTAGAGHLMRLFGIGVEQGVPVVLGDPDVREHGLLAPGLQETYGVQARPVGDVLASGIGGDGHLEGVAARHVRPGGAAVHAFDGTQHDSVEQHDQVRLKMIARSGNLELYAVRLVGVLRSDDVRDIYSREMTLLALHTVVYRESSGFPRLSEVNSGSDIVVLILDAVGEDGAAAALGYPHIVEDIEEGAVLRHADRLRTYPFGAAPALVHQSGLEPGGLRLDIVAILVGDDDLPEIAGHTVKRGPLVGNIDGF